MFGKSSMSTQTPKVFLLPVPMFVALFLVFGASGVPQLLAAVVAAIATNIFIFLGAHFVWTPLLKRAGFWWSSFLLGCAIVAVGLAAAVAHIKLGDPRGMGELSLKAAIAGLLFSWCLAAMRGAQDKKTPNQSSEPTLSSGTSPAGQEPRHR